MKIYNPDTEIILTGTTTRITTKPQNGFGDMFCTLSNMCANLES